MVFELIGVLFFGLSEIIIRKASIFLQNFLCQTGIILGSARIGCILKHRLTKGCRLHQGNILTYNGFEKFLPDTFVLAYIGNNGLAKLGLLALPHNDYSGEFQRGVQALFYLVGYFKYFVEPQKSKVLSLHRNHKKSAATSEFIEKIPILGAQSISM